MRFARTIQQTAARNGRIAHTPRAARHPCPNSSPSGMVSPAAIAGPRLSPAVYSDTTQPRRGVPSPLITAGPITLATATARPSTTVPAASGMVPGSERIRVPIDAMISDHRTRDRRPSRACSAGTRGAITRKHSSGTEVSRARTGGANPVSSPISGTTGPTAAVGVLRVRVISRTVAATSSASGRWRSVGTTLLDCILTISISASHASIVW